MHLHLGRITLLDWFGRGRPLTVTAPLPEHMLATGRALGLSAKTLARVASEQPTAATEGTAVTAAPSAERSKLRTIRPTQYDARS